MTDVELYIPEDIQKKYNYALEDFKKGGNTLVGNRQQLKMLRTSLLNPEEPIAMILGEQGVGKTALVEQLVFESTRTSVPTIMISLSIETLGELPENVMVGRMRTLLKDMAEVQKATAEYNHTDQFRICLFIDEVHKLDGYGQNGNSSGAMNALKEGTGRGEFPVIAATTEDEYRQFVAKDKAFDRRFTKVILPEPPRSVVKEILQRRLEVWKEKGLYVPEVEQGFLEELLKLTDSFIRNQVNPAKSLKMLSNAVAHCHDRYLQTGEEIKLDHKALVAVFTMEGYNIESNVTADYVENVIKRRIIGQPLAVHYITNVVNTSFYTMRNFKRPFILAFLVGTTGTGKTETAKALAEALFGREDAILVVNGGDYSNSEDALTAQHLIGDGMAVNKQQVILLDEVEKSHRNVLNSYMRMIDEGIVKDSLGIERSVNNTALLATSNLGAQIIAKLADIMRTNRFDNPNELSEELEDAWYRQEMTVRKALEKGDNGVNNGIKPEFLERFQLFVPYLPLAKKSIAKIAQNKLLQFKEEQRELHYFVRYPKPFTNEEWKRRNLNYDGDINPISAMIAEDLFSPDASSTGARAINRFMENSVKTKVAKLISDRKKNNLPTNNGAINVGTNGNASFESSEKHRPDVKVEYVEKGEEQRRKQLRQKEKRGRQQVTA